MIWQNEHFINVPKKADTKNQRSIITTTNQWVTHPMTFSQDLKILVEVNRCSLESEIYIGGHSKQEQLVYKEAL